MTDYIINYTDPLKGSFTIKPYTSNGNKFPTVAVKESTAVSANSPLLLHGKGHPEYGERIIENLFHLVENFSGPSAPIIDVSENTIPGSFWHKEVLYFFITGAMTWHEWNGSGWTDITSSVTSNVTAPASPSDGDFWYDTTTYLYRYSDDEREIKSWVKLVHETGLATPGSPTRQMHVNHDGTSSGWVEMPDSSSLDSTYLRLDGMFSMSDSLYGIAGTAAAPAFSFVGDITAGLYSIGAGIVGLSAGSSERLRITSGALSVDGGGVDTGYSALVAAENDIPNKKYVDDVAAGVAGADTFMVSGSFTLDTLTLLDNGSPQIPLAISGLSTDIISIPVSSPVFKVGSVTITDAQHALEQLETQKASLVDGANFIGNVQRTTVETPSSSDLASTNYVDAKFASLAPYVREIVTGTTDPVISFSTITYTTAEYRLMVFKNGVKLYADDTSGSPIVPYGYAEIDTSGSPYTLLGPGNPAADGILLHTAPLVTDVFEIILT